MEKYLLDRLMEYGESDAYPFHMPGHKRQAGAGFAGDFPNPFLWILPRLRDLIISTTRKGF